MAHTRSPAQPPPRTPSGHYASIAPRKPRRVRASGSSKLETGRYPNLLCGHAYSDNFDGFSTFAESQLRSRLPHVGTDIPFLFAVARLFGSPHDVLAGSPMLALARALKCCETNCGYMLHFKTADGTAVADGVTNLIVNSSCKKKALSITVMTIAASCTFNINTSRADFVLPRVLACIVE